MHYNVYYFHFTQVSLTKFLQSEVKIIHIIVQNNTYYSARSRWTKQQHLEKITRGLCQTISHILDVPMKGEAQKRSESITELCSF